MSKNKTTTTFLKIKLKGPSGISYKDIPIDRTPSQVVEEISLYEIETNEVLVQKVVIGTVTELKVVE